MRDETGEDPPREVGVATRGRCGLQSSMRFPFRSLALLAFLACDPAVDGAVDPSSRDTDDPTTETDTGLDGSEDDATDTGDGPLMCQGGSGVVLVGEFTSAEHLGRVDEQDVLAQDTDAASIGEGEQIVADATAYATLEATLGLTLPVVDFAAGPVYVRWGGPSSCYFWGEWPAYWYADQGILAVSYDDHHECPPPRERGGECDYLWSTVDVWRLPTGVTELDFCEAWRGSGNGPCDSGS